MSITFQTETLFDVVDEVPALLRLHYEEVTPERDKARMALNPMWSKYVMVEQAGALALFTARHGAALVGYSVFMLHPYLHSADKMIAVNDLIFLHPDHRHGANGINLIRYSETCLKAMGVHKMTWQVKFSRDFRPILHRLGYADEEVVVGKYIGD